MEQLNQFGIRQFIAALRNIGIKPSLEEVSDAFWLAIQFSEKERQKKLEVSEQKTILQEVKSEKNTKSLPLPLPNKSAVSPPSKPVEKSETGPPSKPVEKPETKKIYPETDKKAEAGIRARQFRSPSVPMLPGMLNLGRALRPLMRRTSSRTKYVLNEDATVHRIAEKGIWFPVLQGAPERWFDVILIVDRTPSMLIWEPLISEFKMFLERHGAFRDVRIWNFTYENSEAHLYAGMHSVNDTIRNPREILNPAGRRLIMIASDCASAVWYTDEISEWLKIWGQYHPTVILQMLPQRLWYGGRLGQETRVKFRSVSWGQENIQLKYDDTDILFKDKVLSGIKMPIVTIESESLASWSYMLIGKGGEWVPGVIFGKEHEIQSDEAEDNISAKERVQRFYATASPTAQQLAGYLAAAPLSVYL